MFHNYARNINLTVIAGIERDLKPCDLISMLFLLHDIPEAAYSSVLLVEQEGEVRGLLRTWAEGVIQNATWKEEFIEALCTCQLHKVIVKLGLDLKTVKQCFSNTCYVDPMKKALYKLCEHMTKEKLEKLHKTLLTYNVHVTDFNCCELILLKLMCNSFMTVNRARGERICEYKIEKLAKVIDLIPGLKPIADELCDVRRTYCSTVVDDTDTAILHDNEPSVERYTMHDFKEEFSMLENMSIDISSDSNHLREDMYPIKNPYRIGVCYIINEEKFFPSKNSIDNCTIHEPLEDRHGSTKDRESLQTTMASLNFKVCYSDDLDHKKICSHIRHVLCKQVSTDDSIFMLCILSHGVKGCIVANDCVQVEIEKIQNLVGEELYKRGIDIPKVIIIQACQGNGIASQIPEKTHELLDDGAKVAELCQDTFTTMVPDGPIAKAKKADFLICKATSPELNAYRSITWTGERVEHNGSIFIKTLCENIQKYSNSKHLCDILVKVNCQIADFFKSKKQDQFAMSENSLTKDLYLQVPK